jgi:hypothetical protein
VNEDPRESLRRMEERVSRASDAAERLIAEAAAGARRDRPPPSGWQMPEPEADPSGRRPGELELLISGLRMVGELVPPEALERLAAALRELLLALRALIDFYVERLERPRQQHAHVQDIPIE